MTLILKDSLINLPVMTGPQAVERMVELFGKDQLLAALGADCVQAVAAERERCAVAAVEFCNGPGRWLPIDMFTEHLVAAILASPGEGEQVPMSDNPNCET